HGLNRRSGRPRDGAITCPPGGTIHGAEVKSRSADRHSGHSNHPAAPRRTNQAPLEAAIRFLRNGLCTHYAGEQEKEPSNHLGAQMRSKFFQLESPLWILSLEEEWGLVEGRHVDSAGTRSR